MSDDILPPFPWSVDPDDRPNMEWNNHIVDADGNRICFMAHADGSDNSKHENAADLIASLGTILAERDAALARAEAAEAEVARTREALLDASAHLIGAAAAYEKHASRNTHLRPRGTADPFYQTRVKDFREAAERARAALTQKEKG